MTDKPDAGELLLCPFCGGEAEMDTQRAYRNIETSHVEDAVAIYCLSCSADMTMCKRDVRPMSDEDIIEALRDQWNRRSSSKRIEELEAGLTKIACFDDDGANEYLKARGSYGRFDEPGSVEIARKTLRLDPS